MIVSVFELKPCSKVEFHKQTVFCNGNKLFVLPKLTNIITETAKNITESECNRNADSITEMASFITDATK